ncbi:MAG: Asp-tRNA(Asn)/Glu-tRNA(Gln) amidotransferase subunit GatC [Ignavibacteria bacterium]|jgi:aspartyl-tRNA(Asn)/glutamyl-tRNA(Gln) amidotransferase subunit C|nr:Asp-tRNA(Asn)/Glu-tRNA(Gln) amidotransferase subunit GatC [Ignavibacteria bacterium]MDH7528569.1 Asp-tRNA(Asn)/Glu-tRNA(Gln) amidotransferase subunit GatC [Ignavibacteria bacterium]NPV11322.1 Asp-tRNA(Asn)/Glu-tRNA(Gln) amidotransferase subunit GatC [Ignavibacteria bacterium]
MKVTRELVIHIAELAHLKLKDDEIEKFQQELNQILEYVDKLNELETENVEPLSHPLPVINVAREDKLVPSVKREEALKNAPDSTEEFFKVPKVI